MIMCEESQKVCGAFKKLTEAIEKNETVVTEVKSNLERFGYATEKVKSTALRCKDGRRI